MTENMKKKLCLVILVGGV